MESRLAKNNGRSHEGDTSGEPLREGENPLPRHDPSAVGADIEALRRQIAEEKLRNDTLCRLADIGKSRANARAHTDADDAVLRRLIEALHRYSAPANGIGSERFANEGGVGTTKEDFTSENKEGRENSEIPLGASATHQTKGVCRVVFRGQTVLGPGLWYGVEFARPCGTTDGSLELTHPRHRAEAGNHRRVYFSCAPNHGLFCRRNALFTSGAGNTVRTLHRFAASIVTAIFVAGSQVTSVPQLRFAVTAKTKAASLYMTLFQQFPQIRGYSAQLFGISEASDTAVKAVAVLSPSDFVLNALETRFVKAPELHRLGQVVVADSGLPPLLISLQPCEESNPFEFWQGRPSELSRVFAQACAKQYSGHRHDLIEKRDALGFLAFSELLWFLLEVGWRRDNVIPAFQRPSSGKPDRRNETRSTFGQSMQLISAELFEQLARPLHKFDGPRRVGMEEVTQALQIIAFMPPLLATSSKSSGDLDDDVSPSPKTSYGLTGQRPMLEARRRRFSRRMRMKQLECWLLLSMSVLLAARFVWSYFYGGSYEVANDLVASTTQHFSVSFALNPELAAEYIIDYAILSAWADSSFLLSSVSVDTGTLFDTTTTTATTTTTTTTTSTSSTTRKITSAPQSTTAVSVKPNVTTGQNPAFTAAQPVRTTRAPSPSGFGGGVSARATFAPGGRRLALDTSEFCGLDACTDTSLTASLLGREVPAEISDLYSAGALPVVNGRNLLCGPIMLYQWRVIPETTVIPSGDDGRSSSSISFETHNYFSRATADTSTNVSGALSVDQEGIEVPNIVFPGFAATYPFDLAYFSSFNSTNATQTRSDLLSVLAGPDYISANGTAAIMFRTLFFNAADGTFYSCGFLFEDSRCGSLVSSARCSVAFFGDTVSITFLVILATATAAVVVVEMYALVKKGCRSRNSSDGLADLPSSSKDEKAEHSLRIMNGAAALCSLRPIAALTMFALLVWEFATLGSILFQLDTVVKNLPMDAYLSESVANVASMEFMFSQATVLLWLQLGQLVYQLFFVVQKAASIPLSNSCFLYYNSCCHSSMLALLVLILVMVLIIILWMAAVVTTEDHSSPFLTFNILLVALSMFGLAPVRSAGSLSVVEGYAVFFSLLISGLAFLVPPLFFGVVAERYQDERRRLPPSVPLRLLVCGKFSKSRHKVFSARTQAKE